MGQEFQVPAVFANKQMSQAFQALNAADDNLAEGIGQSYGVIGYKGKTWSLRYRGERKNIIRPDDGTPAAYLDVIILGQAKQKSKSLYKKYDPNTSDGDRPICSSIDGLVPDADVTAKQSDSCALCPKNVWKTDAATGRKGRECTDYKRLAVLILPTQTKPIMGEALIEPVFLRVPPASLNSLAIMGETMGNQGYHYSSYITRITFDPNKAHPEMVFRPLQGLTDQEAPVILKLREDPTVGRITGAELVGTGMRAVEQVAPPGTSATGLGAIVTQPVSPTAPPPSVATSLQQVVEVTPAAAAQSSIVVVHPLPASPPAATLASTGLGGSVVAPPATPPPPTSAGPNGATGLVDTGFGGVSTASGSAGLSAAVQTVADAGAPDESDSALDARIANMIAGVK